MIVIQNVFLECVIGSAICLFNFPVVYNLHILAAFALSPQMSAPG